MNNIFKNAYFGKAYKTRDGKKAIFIQTYKVGDIRNELVIEDEEVGRKFYLYKDDGSFYHKETIEDIVSEWQEPINEKELDEIAIKKCPYHDNDNLETAYFMGFKAGADYRHNSDMEKLKSVLNSLMVDTRDKAALISLMEELQ